jgi:hypothetical protein
MAIHVISDNEHDLHVLQLSDEPVERTEEHGSGCLIDLDAGGRAVAVEILDRQGCDLGSLADEFGFADQLAEALDALTAAGVQIGAASRPSAVVATGGTATSWSQTDVVTGTAQIPAQSIDLIPA